ncbi:AAA family ATPase [Candidatus Dependentiae bacterium]|nr:AAA family ATPase [Candidatus Dependentiae bacterium]
MKKIPTGTSSFENLITQDFIYVDKTKIIYDLINGRDSLYFLSRPRRFGKTLLLSTLKSLFEGKRELFKGLWIDSSDYQWKSHPVISLDFSGLTSSTPEILEKELIYHLELQAEKFSIDLSKAPSTSLSKLAGLITALAQKNKIVILIDEYDYPIVNSLGNNFAQENLTIINSFFTGLKSHSANFRAIFVTGVSPIPKTSAYSGMNILNNISLDPIAASLLGYTKEELMTYFSEHIGQLALVEQMAEKELLEKIQLWYNGYRFSEEDKKVYNPFSLHYLFMKKRFANYWFSVATPKFLRHFLKTHTYDLQALDGGFFTADSLTTLSLDALKPRLDTLLFQAGYLTISTYTKETNSYRLDYPNHEIKESYAILLMATLADTDENIINQAAPLVRNALFTNDIDELCLQLKIIFARIPYQIAEHTEKFYHALVQGFFLLLGLESHSEISTNRGRIDMAVFTKKFTYIFEFKVKKSPKAVNVQGEPRNQKDVAFEQIKDRAYYERYLSSPKMETKSIIVLVGLTFSKYDGDATVQCIHKILF